jgi:glycerophosphoryl diester phosphodiesterase
MVLRIGHRGAMGYEPENTLRSFKKALDLGCHMVELDVHVCKTGEVMVIHDDTLERTTNGTGPVREKTLAELRMLDAGKGERIPLLTDVLDRFSGKIGVNIELKGTATARPVARILSRYRMEGRWSGQDGLISSFHCDELSAFRKLDPETPVGILFREIPAGLFEYARQIAAHSLNPCYDIASRELVDRAHDEGLKVFVWTVDSPEEIDRMKKLGVDCICSNFPDRV